MKISKAWRKYYKVEDINGTWRTHGTTGQMGKCGNDWIESNAKESHLAEEYVHVQDRGDAQRSRVELQSCDVTGVTG